MQLAFKRKFLVSFAFWRDFCVPGTPGILVGLDHLTPVGRSFYRLAARIPQTFTQSDLQPFIHTPTAELLHQEVLRSNGGEPKRRHRQQRLN